MSILLITNIPSAANSILEEHELKDSIFITPCLIKAREYAKFFNPDRILISEEIQTNENLQVLKSWPLMLTGKFDLLKNLSREPNVHKPGKITDIKLSVEKNVKTV